MSTWKDFEISATDYLNKAFGDYAVFTHQGEEDSTVPDILVETNTGKSFYIEAKHSPAQCGQFVLLPDISTESFTYSPQNVNHLNVYAKEIISLMDNEFEEFKEAGTAGKDINLPESVFVDWIIDSYKAKGVKFIITNDNTILHLEDFGKYFTVSAKYRIKRSGSSSVGKSRINPVKDYIISHAYNVDTSRVEDDKLFVESRSNLHNTRFYLAQYEYMFSQRGDEYEIRKLSNTFNANVIFSIEKKDCVSGISNNDFISSLK